MSLNSQYRIHLPMPSSLADSDIEEFPDSEIYEDEEDNLEEELYENFEEVYDPPDDYEREWEFYEPEEESLPSEDNTCIVCDGLGMEYDNLCPVCHGTGKKEV